MHKLHKCHLQKYAKANKLLFSYMSPKQLCSQLPQQERLSKITRCNHSQTFQRLKATNHSIINGDQIIIRNSHEHSPVRLLQESFLLSNGVQ